ncbi:MAG TPA: hypothetical protein VMU89_21340 [Thermomicrobiaceae bacterium]|nr:hypothetical protein [Thermomicrobiaceae bacterium]
MNVRGVLLWGFAGTTILTTIMRAAQALGRTRVDLPLILGLIFTADRSRAKVYGTLVHLVNGWLFAFVYATVFEQLRRATWWVGALVGMVHALFVLVIGMSALPGLHPRMATDATGPEPTLELEPPGFLAMNYGRQTAIVTFIAHLIFGAVLGSLYRVRR